MTAERSVAPHILKLSVERFRGIEKLDWLPGKCVNIILGGGDAGKTTILEAIALLLAPTNNSQLTDADYWQRNVEAGFCIEAVMSLAPDTGINEQVRQAWPWQWNGTAAVAPQATDDDPTGAAAIPAYRMRVRGNADFDLIYEIVQPHEEVDHFSVALRRRIGLVRLSGDEKNDRDLRLIQGSAIDRLLDDRTLRSKLGQRLANEDIENELKEDAKERLSELDRVFASKKLPDHLRLAFTGGQGLSINALIGLTAAKSGTQLPLASWGSGTRRLAVLQIASSKQSALPITVVDEVERGLEPYRQRTLMAELSASGTQVFCTTHSPIALHSARCATISYLDAGGTIGVLPSIIDRHRKRDPEIFLSRLAVIAEGATEQGFLSVLLERALGSDPLEFGLRIADGTGNDETLTLLEALANHGLKAAGFADNEDRNDGRWSAVKDKLGDLVFRWDRGCTEENIIPLVGDEDLEAFIADKDGELGERLKSLADRLRSADKSLGTLTEQAEDLKQVIIQAALGKKPDFVDADDKPTVKKFAKHSQRWFKSYDGGQELAQKVLAFGIWPKISSQVMPFLNAVRQAVGLPDIADLQL